MDSCYLGETQTTCKELDNKRREIEKLLVSEKNAGFYLQITFAFHRKKKTK